MGSRLPIKIFDCHAYSNCTSGQQVPTSSATGSVRWKSAYRQYQHSAYPWDAFCLGVKAGHHCCGQTLPFRFNSDMVSHRSCPVIGWHLLTFLFVQYRTDTLHLDAL